MTNEMARLIHENNYFIDWEARDYSIIDHTDEQGFYDNLRENFFNCCDAMIFEEWLRENYTADILYWDLQKGMSLEDIWNEYEEYCDEEMANFLKDSQTFLWL